MQACIAFQLFYFDWGAKRGAILYNSVQYSFCFELLVISV
jgi:hypothetical protein